MVDKHYLVQVKRTNGILEKGVVVKDSLEDAKQGYHAYMAAYAYKHDANTDYVMTEVLNSKGLGMVGETWELKEDELEVTEGTE